MVRAGIWFIVGMVLLWVGVVQAGPKQFLNGDYAFTGEASCDADLTPQDFQAFFTYDVASDGTLTTQELIP